ncbi:MAG: FecR domain-containing protein [Fibrobacter sp.]|nr:FecR domain-containing protein [Fibrobacter sp.]
MSFSRSFRLLATLLVLLVGVSFAAKAQSGKVHYAVGEVFLHRSGNIQVIKSSDPEKNKLKKAKTVKKGDDIETLLESEVIIALPDGSSFNVQENTIVAITELSFEDGENNFITEVKRGSMKFDVQKQANKKKIKFKTGIATAAIRGTDGFVGKANGCEIASLATGNLDFEISTTQKTHAITGGQTIIYCKDAVIVADLESSGNGELFKALDSVLTDTTLSADAIRKAAEEADKKISEKQKELRAKIECHIDPLPDIVYSAKQTISATCTEGTHIRIFGDPVRSDGNAIQLSVEWAPSTIGQKKIPLTCFYDGDSTNTMQCGLVTTYFAGTNDSTVAGEQALLTITSSTPIEVCDPAMVTIEGTFDTTDQNAVLTVSLGKYISKNLVPLSANGKFQHSIPVSDKNGNWNENTLYVNFKSKNGNKNAEVPIRVVKSCKTVNLLPPTLALYANQCKAALALGQTDGDKAIYTLYVDNVAQKEIYFESDRKFYENLVSGTHMYRFHVEDLAGNKVDLSQKLQCYPPLRNVKIVVVGGEETEDIPVPPPPRGFNPKIHRQLTFTVKNLPQNDPTYIKQIDITLPGQNIQLRGSDLQSNRIDQQIELSRGNTTVKITVTLKSGEIITATKPYKVH